ncbi:hypothetical protein AB8Q80_13590 [Klebsiella pneumoniae]|nr:MULTISPECIES: hypothetical protein [Klebsiella/Raoultella group]EKZ5360213.1 hypothetical protein [Klebsiella pneumoniae]MCS6673483.1 hypothetical protein [Klebsiella pneumoniae subsp. pneumoniae]MDC7942346.1 hypothetical protein [Raoultella ornithinolytica]MDU0021677.1 hypothetical protein [Klebsiella pneumoniae]SWG25558.1 Uncharacterised protein [Klebsiella pneumoniae]
MSEKTETKTNFDQTASPLKGIKNIMTPAGVVMRVTDTDLKWFTHFYTFEAQGKKCYQSIKTIAKEFDRAVSVAQERIDKLQALGLLDVGKEPFKDGWRNTYTCTPIDVIVSRMTEAPVTPQDKPLKKSQLNSLLKKSGKVDSHAVNRGIKAMAKTIANRDLSDEEVMQFAFQIATEKLAALGWPIESIIEESNDEEDLQPATDGPETASPAAGKPDGVPVVDIPVDADLSGSDDPSLSDSTGRNVVELPRNGRPKLSFKFVSPDDDDQEETYQGYGGDIEQETYSEPTQADFDAALENL